jgi:hypothetical protein
MKKRTQLGEVGFLTVQSHWWGRDSEVEKRSQPYAVFCASKPGVGRVLDFEKTNPTTDEK